MADQLEVAQVIAKQLRVEMRQGKNYIRSDRGILRFTILPMHLDALLKIIEGAASRP